MIAGLTALILPFILCSSVLAHDDDGCPQNFRRCNDQCLDKTTNHTIPCEEGPWGKCLSARFPFYCALTNTCKGKDELCGDLCFNGSPGSFWYDHWAKIERNCWGCGDEWIEKDNEWRLNEDAYDIISGGYKRKYGIWLERYNCDGKCVTYLESCHGGCDHIDDGGKRIKCGKECRRKQDMRGFHDCGEECLSQMFPCNGTCPIATGIASGPQWKCGNECRTTRANFWKECPDGTCRGKDIRCDIPPGTCPEGEVPCIYDAGWKPGTDFNCVDNSTAYICKENGRCKNYDQLCDGECQPGYMKCGDRCRDPTKYIKCGDTCKESGQYHNCDGTCVSTEEACNGNCAAGFEMCAGKCVLSTDITRCNGKCQLSSDMCDGKCLKNGWFKGGDICRPDAEKKNFRECDGIFLDLETPCNGMCGPNRWPYWQICGEKCLKRDDIQDCDGQCKHKKETCNGKCYFSDNVACGNHCIEVTEPCEGECHDVDHPFKCTTWRGETCLESKYIDDGNDNCLDGSDEKTTCYQGWICDGKMQCWDQPCHGTCQSHLNVTQKNHMKYEMNSYAVHYCPQDDKCKLEFEPCNGVCLFDIQYKRGFTSGRITKAKDLFACHDGSNCIHKEKVCDGVKSCNDGSDEICKVRGCENCKVEVVDDHMNRNFVCESGDQKVHISDFCDGTEDCRDGSDEKDCDTCPGIVVCNSNDHTYNDEFVCANIPCKNERNNNNEIFCSTMGSAFLWDLCYEEQTKEPKCVKRSWRGGQFTSQKGKPVEGEVCNGECLHPMRGGIKCGDKCLPKPIWTRNTRACNGTCPGSLMHCDGWCLESNEDARFCDGECRYFGDHYSGIGIRSKGPRDVASRKTCNGVCLSGGDGKEAWLPCSTGNECFPAKEWCDGVNNCKDGSDESKCSICPKLVRCEHQNHPLTNQTASNGPRFPDYVCSNEPCGDCSDPDTYPCGNSCISTLQKCALTGRCSSTMFQCEEECLDPDLVCDGKVDCKGKGGEDEQGCNNIYQGSWICNGNIQSKTKVCLQ